MYYTVGEMSKILNIPPSTLRYYDKEGLLPLVERSKNGIRMFKDTDYEMLRIIDCLKKTGMSLKDIKNFIALVMAGDSTIDERLALFEKQKELVEEKIQELELAKQVIEYKCWYYSTAKEANSTDAPQSLLQEDIPTNLQKVHQYLKEFTPQ